MRPDRGTLGDLAKLAITTGLGGAAALTPPAARSFVVSRLEALGSRMRHDELDEMTGYLGRRLPDRTQTELHAVASEMRALRVEHAFCRGYGVFRRGWPAEIEVTGAEHLHASHAAGRGVIVWLMTFLDSTPFNLAAAAEGFPVTHLSEVRHGMRGGGPISLRLISPILLRGEKRSLRRRVLISPSGSLDYLRTLQATIEDDHGTVTIRGHFGKGRRTIATRFLGEETHIPTGAPSLAHKTGAPLLTTATVRRGPLHHEVIIDEPISAARTLDRRAFQIAAVEEFASRLDQRAREYPGSLPWLHMRQAMQQAAAP